MRREKNGSVGQHRHFRVLNVGRPSGMGFSPFLPPVLWSVIAKFCQSSLPFIKVIKVQSLQFIFNRAFESSEFAILDTCVLTDSCFDTA